MPKQLIPWQLALKLAFFNAVVGLFFAAVMIDRPRRLPALVVLVPLLACANMLIIWWKRRNPTSITLILVYGFGLLWGIAWTASEFAWWKLPLFLLPIALLMQSIHRFSRENASRLQK